jgi:hypothetical protein
MSSLITNTLSLEYCTILLLHSFLVSDLGQETILFIDLLYLIGVFNYLLF